ncbi:hypothetical protein [Segetibacter sp.]|jgi:hypothetical protein|uniref:hypothetical protein n=1 Tax=Segetibacter sp. TaxID=2231182 RepID=UPI0026221D92|nr:hypothetical protein [Segetibacter sp.]
MMEQVLNYYPFIALCCIAALIVFKFRLSKYLKHSEQFSLVFYPVEVVEIRRKTLIRRQYFLTGIIGLLLVSVAMLSFNNTTQTNISSNVSAETPVARKVSFKHKRKIYKVDVNLLSGNEGDTVYKLYFRSTGKDTGNNTMELFKKENSDGSVTWECKSDSSSDKQFKEFASVAGAAIEKILQEKNKGS